MWRLTSATLPASWATLISFLVRFLLRQVNTTLRWPGLNPSTKLKIDLLFVISCFVMEAYNNNFRWKKKPKRKWTKNGFFFDLQNFILRKIRHNFNNTLKKKMFLKLAMPIWSTNKTNFLKSCKLIIKKCFQKILAPKTKHELSERRLYWRKHFKSLKAYS